MKIICRAFMLAALMLVILLSLANAETVNIVADYVQTEAFAGDTSITQLSLGENVLEIGSNAFTDCTALTQVSCSSRNVDIAENAFDRAPIECVTCYLKSSMDTWARSKGIPRRYMDAFRISCGTDQFACLGLPVTWSLTDVMPGESVSNKFSYAVYYSGIDEPVYEVTDTAALSLTYTPPKTGTYSLTVTITNSLTTTTLTSAPLSIPNTLTMGTYSGQSVAWRLLTVEGNKALFITDKVIEEGSYFNPSWIKFKYTYWSGSYIGSEPDNYKGSGEATDASRYKPKITPTSVPLKNGSRGTDDDLFYLHCRYWCNNTFYNSAFTDEERSVILKSTLQNEDNATYKVDGGPVTQDYIFFLSYNEIMKYMPSTSNRKASTTSHASNVDYYWLRTPGQYRVNAMYVYLSTGRISTAGSDVGHSNRLGYRPAMWISIG